MAKKKKESQVQEIIAVLLEDAKREGVITAKKISDALSEQMEVTAEQLDSMYAILKSFLMMNMLLKVTCIYMMNY